ncbi:hypothetical protein N7517_003384 [Penicillium concentricum]|uniref:F-box domain-containing protein n=1 Tax=Penicillium concentricum TaxID=293559 RepID=A0A9W9SVI9_9EURO|nr:uncharacterized protein N7517_003384 [Penicillium concentricum]KAJ5385473.1 hypothetical protein N7517_003384 [Penicillium concentricum]
MGFSKLPVELNLYIVAFFKYESDLNSFVRTSKFTYRLMNDFLYRHNVLYFGSSALEWAARNGVERTALMSLEAGALPSACVDEEWQPMALAAAHGHDNVVKLFLDLGVDPCRREGWRPLTEEFLTQQEFESDGYPNICFKPESDPLTLAIENGFENVVRLLITHGATRDWNNRNAMAAIYIAIARGHLTLVKLLVEMFPQSINEASRDDAKGPLIFAIRHNKPAIARFLISVGADVNIACDRKITPLGLAAVGGDLETVMFLVEKGACPDPEMCGGATLWPLRWAAERKRYDIVEYLLSKIDVDAKISKGGDDLAILLFVSALCGLESLLREILASGCDVNIVCRCDYPDYSSWPRPALSAAAGRGRVDIATILLEHGARLYGEEPDEKRGYEPKYQPLFSACRGGHIEAVKLLLDHGLDLKKAETERNSAVIAAIGFPQIIDLLLSRGAEGQARFYNDKANPMTEAVRSGGIASVQVLLGHNVPVEPAFLTRNESLIGEASKSKDGPAMLDLLAAHDVVAQADDKHAQQVLQATIRRGGAAVTEFFLKRGFDPNLKLYEHSGNSKSYLEDALAANNQKAAEATIDVLLRYGADINDLQGYSHNFILCQAESKCLSYVRLLLDRGANPLPENRFGLSLLEFAAKNNYKAFLREVLRYIDAQNLPFADIQRNFSLVESHPEVRKNWHAMNIWESFYWRNKYPMSS